jgi:hypothetical protein
MVQRKDFRHLSFAEHVGTGEFGPDIFLQSGFSRSNAGLSSAMISGAAVHKTLDKNVVGAMIQIAVRRVFEWRKACIPSCFLTEHDARKKMPGASLGRRVSKFWLRRGLK